MLFCKRTRTIYRWMYPNIKKHELNRRVANAWDSAAEEEKNIYISQVVYFIPIARRSHFDNRLVYGLVLIWNSKRLEKATFRKLDLFPFSEQGRKTHTLLGPVERANLSH
jgi:hypothetical protein